MKRLLAASALLFAAACTPATEPAASVEQEAALVLPSDAEKPLIDPETAALAGVWLLTATTAPDTACRITLAPEDVGEGLLVTRVALRDPACTEAVPVTATITQWSASGDGGVYLIASTGGDSQENIIEFGASDASGVFTGTDAAGLTYSMSRAP